MKIKKTQNVVIVVLFLLSLPGSIVAQTGNHFCGDYAGNSNTTAVGNSFFGCYAGYTNTTGSYNTFLGLKAENETLKERINALEKKSKD